MKTTAPERVDLPVSGMTCAACARSIERTLANTPGVDRASVNLATNTATVEFDPGVAQVRDFVGAIEELGYGVPEKEAPADAAEQGYRGACWWRRSSRRRCWCSACRTACCMYRTRHGFNWRSRCR